jgi:hypothetical protein
MATDGQPEWAKSLSERAGELAAGFAHALEQVGHIMAAQGAMGWMFRGDLDAARKSLMGLPVEQLQTVSVTASALASVADEIAMERKPSAGLASG